MKGDRYIRMERKKSETLTFLQGVKSSGLRPSRGMDERGLVRVWSGRLSPGLLHMRRMGRFTCRRRCSGRVNVTCCVLLHVVVLASCQHRRGCVIHMTDQIKSSRKHFTFGVVRGAVVCRCIGNFKDVKCSRLCPPITPCYQKTETSVSLHYRRSSSSQ
jgi:hypothetical protein